MKKFLPALKKITLQVLLALGKIALTFVLFIVAVAVFVQIIAIWDTRHLEKGDSPHQNFRIALFSASDDSFSLGSLSQAAECSSKGDCYLIPVKKHEEIKVAEFSYWNYDLLEKTGNHALIQTTDGDDDYTFWYTYAVDNNNVITPVKTKMLGIGYMFPAMAMTIVCFWLFGRFGPALMAKLFGLLKRRIQSK